MGDGMKKILSSSKMREVMPLINKDGKERTAVFTKGEITQISDGDYKYLVEQPGSIFQFLLDEGTFKVIEDKESEKIEQPVIKLSKKELKKLAELEKKKAEKLADEIKKARQGN